MSAYVLMRILESAPHRYDRGIRLLTLGRIDEVYDRLTSHVKRGERILDIGCGTGSLTIRAARRGARVKGIDVNAQILEIARKRIAEARLEENVELCEMGVAELGGEAAGSYDAVMSGLCFSELTEDELIYTLREVRRILKPGGVLIIADEVRPKSILKRILSGLIRSPLVMIAYLITQTTTRAVKNLPDRIKEAGFTIELLEINRMENFVEIIAGRGD